MILAADNEPARITEAYEQLKFIAVNPEDLEDDQEAGFGFDEEMALEPYAEQGESGHRTADVSVTSLLETCYVADQPQ